MATGRRFYSSTLLDVRASEQTKLRYWKRGFGEPQIGTVEQFERWCAASQIPEYIVAAVCAERQLYLTKERDLAKRKTSRFQERNGIREFGAQVRVTIPRPLCKRGRTISAMVIADNEEWRVCHTDQGNAVLQWRHRGALSSARVVAPADLPSPMREHPHVAHVFGLGTPPAPKTEEYDPSSHDC